MTRGARLPYRSAAELAGWAAGLEADGMRRAEAAASVAEMPARCPHCDAPAGWVHVAGCQWERCPRCGGQLITCEDFGCMAGAD